MNRILIDAFGGDNAPLEVIEGTLNAIKENKNFTAVLVGKEQEIAKILSEKTYDKSRIEILNAEDIITCEEEPTMAIRRKPNSSICVAFKELKESESAKAFVSAGSTGAVLVGATLKLGRIKNVNRPALCPTLPTVDGDKKVFLLDAGANADCKPINICQFALMGTIYAKTMGVENPKVALLSNGTEDEKGNAFNHEVFPMLKGMQDINFVGNCEARDILSGKYDVIVSDGFSGNVAIKSLEGGIMSLMKLLKKGIYSSLKSKIGAMLLKPVLNDIKLKLDYNNNGGAFFIGVDKVVIKAHGSSKRVAIKNAILQATTFSELEIVEKLKEKFAECNFEVVNAQ